MIVARSKVLALRYIKTRARFYEYWIRPLSSGFENQRRELVVNILLINLAVASVVAVVTSVFYHVVLSNGEPVAELAISLGFMGTIFSGLIISRKGHFKVATYAVVLLLLMATLQLTFAYSFELPIVSLLCALTIVVAGILLSLRGAIITSLLIVIALIAISYGQVSHHLNPDLTWQNQDAQTGDAIGFIAVLSLVALISWLANREIKRSLLLAISSKTALANERDQLEIKIAERTRDLIESQRIRSQELQHFAEFGRLSANLLHEVANPLTAASLNLQQLTGRQNKSVVQAQANIKRIECYVIAARKQLQRESPATRFLVDIELQEIKQLLIPLAKSKQIDLIVITPASYELYGDTVKFHQLISNLIVNAIDAYSDTNIAYHARQIRVGLSATKSSVVIQVSDYGVGIPRSLINLIFDPFWTTKSSTNRGLGIGLALVKGHIEHDFNGTITVTSTPNKGTIFTVRLRRPDAGIGVASPLDAAFEQ